VRLRDRPTRERSRAVHGPGRRFGEAENSREPTSGQQENHSQRRVRARADLQRVNRRTANEKNTGTRNVCE